MLQKSMRRSQRRWRSRCVWMRRLKHDWATHGWNWNYVWVHPWYSKQKADCSIWAETTLCACFYDPSFKGMARFKDTPSMNHRQRSCNGWEGDRINEYKDEQKLEVEREFHGSDRKSGRRRDPRRMKVTCLCGYLVGHVMVEPGESSWKEISKKYGDRYPKCPDCSEKKRFTRVG